jgi:hypothetical protein
MQNNFKVSKLNLHLEYETEWETTYEAISATVLYQFPDLKPIQKNYTATNEAGIASLVIGKNSNNC